MTDDDAQHCSEVFRVDTGDRVTLVTDDGDEIDVEVTGTSRHNDETGPNIIEQTTITFEREGDGHTLKLVKLEGLSGTPGESPFPSHSQLHDVTDERRGHQIPNDDLLGYVDEVVR